MEAKLLNPDGTPMRFVAAEDGQEPFEVELHIFAGGRLAAVRIQDLVYEEPPMSPDATREPRGPGNKDIDVNDFGRAVPAAPAA